ncbi:restriction endonuclease subunit S [Pseudomonas sp. Lb2C1-1]|jgi:type I restriction enzyme S subunit|uniref:restriction endonuclease subunit S n=1 Tax=Pseudomonas TaxID=286 RepID=UPI0039196F78
MSGGLPTGWTSFTLLDIGGVSGGKTPSKANAEFWSSPDVPWVSPKDMKRDLLVDAEDRISQMAVGAAGMTLYPAGAVLMVTRSGILQHTFPVALAGVELTVNQDIKVLRPIEGINPEFAFYMLKSFGGEILSACSKDGTTVQSIDSEKLGAFPFPLAPADEQIRIAQKLDELLAQVDTLKARIDAIPTLFKRFRQSVLAAAVSGRLTEEWRKQNQSTGTGEDVIKNDRLAKLALLNEQPELKKKKSSVQSDIDESYLFEIPESWCFTTWGKISEWITYGFTRPMPKSESGKKLLTAKDVQRFELELIDCGLTTTEAFEALSDKDKPIKGDLLITKDGSIGRAALVKTEEDFCINQSVAVCWLRSTTMNKRYLELLSNSDFTQRFVRDKAQGMAIQHLSIIDFAKCPIPVPSNTEQDEIVRRIEQLFAFADQLETTVASAKSRIGHLTQSILAKAFRGELVPQDPNDEPASVLLERIQTQRAALKAKRGRKASA